MKRIILIIGALILTTSELQSQPLPDTVNGKVTEVPKEEKPFYEKTWFTTLMGSCLGAGLAFSVTYRMYYLANKRADMLRIEQEQKEKVEKLLKSKKEVIHQLKDYRAEITAYVDIPTKQTPTFRCKLTPHFELLFLI